MHYFEEIPQHYHTCALFDSPQMDKLMIPEVYNRECQMNIFEVLATSSTSEVVCGPIIDLTHLGLNIPNTPLKLQITEHLNL